MVRQILFLVRIVCRCPDRDCNLSAGNAAISVFVIFEKVCTRKQCPETLVRRVHNRSEKTPGEPNLP
jgi:ribosomal protein RSM22 (predicted rRNA methylase)